MSMKNTKRTIEQLLLTDTILCQGHIDKEKKSKVSPGYWAVISIISRDNDSTFPR